MIAVLVRDQDGRERFRGDADGVEPLESFLAGKSGVDEDAGALGGNQGGVAGTRRGQNREFEDGEELL